MMAFVPSESETSADEKLVESLRFIEFFKRSFVPAGADSPPFYEGLLSDASVLAWNAPAAQIKMLAVYLHHGNNPHSTTLAGHLIMREVLEVMEQHCVLWGWDVSSPHNWQLICEMVMDNFGNGSGEMLQEIEESEFPCVLLLSRGKEGLVLVQAVLPTSSKFNTLSSLYHAVDLFEGKIKPDLILKETSKKQKSLFCGGSWTKVTEAMAINANMATYRFQNNLPAAGTLTKAQDENGSGRSEGEFDLDLNGILKIRQVREDRPVQVTHFSGGRTQSKRERMTALFGLMRDELASRKCAIVGSQIN